MPNETLELERSRAQKRLQTAQRTPKVHVNVQVKGPLQLVQGQHLVHVRVYSTSTGKPRHVLVAMGAKRVY